MVDLRNQVKTFEARLSKAVNDAVVQTAKELKNQFEHERALVTAQSDGTRNLLEQQVVTLQNTVTEQRKEIDRLNQMIIDASNQVTRIAERAVSRPETLHPPKPSHSSNKTNHSNVPDYSADLILYPCDELRGTPQSPEYSRGRTAQPASSNISKE